MSSIAEQYTVESVNLKEYAQQVFNVARENNEDPAAIAVSYIRIGKNILKILEDEEGAAK